MVDLCKAAITEGVRESPKFPLTVMRTPIPLEVLVLNNSSMFPELMWSREYLDDQILIHCNLCQCPLDQYGELLFPSVFSLDSSS